MDTTPDTPLPISVEMAERVHLYGGPEADSGDLPEIAALIDARVRPLVEALPTVPHPGGKLIRVVAQYEDGSTQTIDGDVITAALRSSELSADEHIKEKPVRLSAANGGSHRHWQF